MDIRSSVKQFLLKVDCLRVVVEYVLAFLLMPSFTKKQNTGKSKEVTG